MACHQGIFFKPLWNLKKKLIYATGLLRQHFTLLASGIREKIVPLKYVEQRKAFKHND